MSREERRWVRKGTHRVAVQRKYKVLAKAAAREIKER
jgi:hypothetical protein